MTEKTDTKKSNAIILENRANLSISGVSNVDNFDTEKITVYTDYGQITVKGNALHMDSLNTQTGELFIQGKIDSVIYSDEGTGESGFFSRLFK